MFGIIVYMKCKKCKDVIDSDTEYCGRCILESVQDVPVKKSKTRGNGCGIHLIRNKKK